MKDRLRETASSRIESVQIDCKLAGPDEPVFIIAEIGTSHGGDLQTAEKLIDAAIDAGADCVKLQAVFADEIVHPQTGAVDLPGGKTALYQVFRTVERQTEFYRHLKSYIEKKGAVFLCSPFGMQSAKILADIGSTAVKVASPEINHFPLLAFLADWGAHVILSSGVSTLADIERALQALPQKKALLHCVTAYPAPPEEYNVRVVPLLSRLFNVPVGVSDHSTDPVLVPMLAVLMGSCIIEKHFTLSRTGSGLDDPVALPPTEFEEMVKAVRESESDEPGNVLEKAERLFGKRRIETVIGTGSKILAASEKDNYRTTNRSIMAIADIEEGEILSDRNIALLRSEKNLSPGIAPEFYAIIKGKRATRRVSSGGGIQWDDLLTDG